MPTVNVSGNTGLERTDEPALNLYRNQGALTATYNLFDAALTKNKIRTGQSLEKVANSDFDTTLQDVLFQGIQSHLDFVLQTQLVGISTNIIDVLRDIAGFIKRERDIGRMTSADLLQAEARIEQAREALFAYEGARDRSVVRYKKLFGHAPTAVQLIDILAPIEPLPKTLESALEYAVKNNPQIRRARHTADASKFDRDATEAGNWPRIDLEGGLNLKRNVDGVEAFENEASVLFKMNWNLFDGALTSSTQRAATHRMAAAQKAIDIQRLEIEEQVEMAWSLFATERKRLEALDRAEEIASEAFRARNQLMKVGKESLINVLGMSVEVLNVKIAVLNADYSQRASAFRVLQTVGLLQLESLEKVIMGQVMEPVILKSAFLDNLMRPTDEFAPVVTEKAESAVKEGPPVEVNSAVKDRPPLELKTTPKDRAAPQNAKGTLISIPRMTPSQPSTVRLLPTTTGSTKGRSSTLQPVSRGGHFIVMSSNRRKENAIKDQSKFAFPGARVETFTVRGKNMYMVVSGPYSLKDARTISLDAEAMGIKGAWVKKN